MLDWDPLDFMTVLECEPQIYDADYDSTIYEIERDGLTLRVVVSPFHQTLQIEIYRVASRLISVTVFVRGKAYRFYEKQIECLVITDCYVIADWYDTGEPNTNHKSFITAKIFLKPHIQVTFN